MRNKYYHVYLTYEEYSELIKQLVESKNKLHEQGRYTDAVDDLIIKISKCKKKKLKKL